MSRGGKRRNSVPTSGQPEAGFELAEAASQSRPSLPENIDLSDCSALKRALDDAAISIVLESGMREKFTVSNIKIFLGAFTCSWAALAQFFPKKHPYQWHVIVTSLVVYVICSAVLSLLMWRMEADAFFFADKGHRGSPVLSMSSLMPKYQDRYTLVLKMRKRSVDEPHVVATEEDTVTKWFDSNGLLLRQRFAAVVTKALRSYDDAVKQ